MEAAPDNDEQATEQPSGRASRLPAQITLGWPFFTYQLPLKGLLVVAAAAAVVMIAAVFVALSTLGSGTSGVVELRPFRLEATRTETQSGDEFTSTAVIEWQDERHYRNTTTTLDGEFGSGNVSADGEWLWLVFSNSTTYTRSEIRELSFNDPSSRFLYTMFGPMSGASSIDNLLDELTEQQKEFGPGKVRYARVAGQETHLGIPVTVIKYGPLWNDSTPDKLANNWTINTGGSAKMWIDPETMFILRSEAEVRDGLSYLVEVTSLEYNAEFAPGTFTFVPPADKTMVIE